MLFKRKYFLVQNLFKIKVLSIHLQLFNNEWSSLESELQATSDMTV